jgi:hypothetical protein
MILPVAENEGPGQGVTKGCRLSLLINSALANTSPNAGKVGVLGSRPMSTPVHIT